MGCFGLVREIIHVPTVFPQGHALIVVPASILVADTMGIANKEGANLLFHTKGDDFAGGFVPQIAHTPFGATALLVFGSLQLLPAPRILFAPGLFPGNFAQLLTSLVFERTDAAPGDDHGLPGVGAHGCQVDLAQIYCGLDRARSLFCLW